jgi:hypothetical protein
MRIYISGAITKEKGFYRKFLNAENDLKRKGHDVINPARIGKVLPKKMDYEEYMTIDFVLLDMCDAICMLQGWENSDGAKREFEHAKANEKKIFYQRSAKC